MTQALNRIRIALNLATMTDAELLQLVVAIAALAPKSALINVAAIAASVGAVATKGTTFKSAGETVTQTEGLLKTQKSTALSARGTLENEVASLAGLVAANATDETQVTTMGFGVIGPRTVDTAPPEMPQSLDIKIPKTAKGRARVSVHETGKTHGRYVAESSPDPVGPTTWSPLPGTGKSRTLTGPSGTKVWVRFARVRGQLQSDWSTPVLVTLP